VVPKDKVLFKNRDTNKATSELFTVWFNNTAKYTVKLSAQMKVVQDNSASGVMHKNMDRQERIWMVQQNK
jgi:hypothetical protein